ncbi:hypothetical protein [Sphingopyxis sp. 22461]|uniref:hypothetical protein n=1 Tax=Sphingopyxis sp. 22461 TaxID=3453923 RepID=UPI003F82BD2D
MTIPRYSRTSDWPRLVADAVNALENKVKALLGATAYTVETITFTPIAEPASPVEGMTYMDSTSHKLRTYNGTTWQDHW